jgi:phosphatidylglycerophosphate synthase
MLLPVAAAVLIQLRLICNLIDGMMAIEGGLRTKCGDMFNEFPDRIADSLLLIGAGYATQLAAVGCQLGWSAALFACITAYIRMFGAAKGLGHDFSGPLAKQQRMFYLTLACVLTPLESHLFHSNWSMLAALSIINIGTVVTCVRRTCKIARGLQNK